MQEKVSIGGVAAVIHRPEKVSNKLAILCPGYLDSKDYAHLVTLAEDLAALGYTAVRFDPTGTWESAGTIEQYLTSQYLADVRSVLEYMLKERDYERVLIGGHSRGGMVSILYAAQDHCISVVLAIMPSSSEPSRSAISLSGKRGEEWQKTGYETSWRDVPGSSEKRKFDVPYAHVKDRIQYDVPSALKKIQVPIVLVAGENDDKILPERVQRMFEQANEPKAFTIIPDIGHDYRHNPKEIRIVNDIALAELEKLHA